MQSALSWRGNKIFLYTLTILLCVLFFTPLLWTFVTSLKSIYSDMTSLIPNSINWINYKLAVTLVPYARYVGNSFIITGTWVTLTTASSSLVAFGFARLRAPGKNFFFMAILSTMMLPAFVMQIPTYIVFSNFSLTNNYWPWFIWGLGGNAFYIFLFRQFYMNIPKELEEAARIDGCSTFGIYWRIFLPISVPITATVLVMAFQASWGDYMTPFMFLNGDQWPLATALISTTYTIPNQPNTPMIPVVDASTILYIIPAIVAFFLGQRFLIQGIVTTGIKE